LKKKQAKFYMAMGEYELEVRKKGMNYAVSQIKKNMIDHRYYQIPNGGHVSLSREKLIEALRFIFD
jgi:hypothetical protein